MAVRRPVATSTTIPESCYLRFTKLPPRLKTQALEWPATRRLFVTSVASYVDREHLHFSSRTRGEAVTRVMVVTGGSGTINLPDGTYHLTAGSVFVLPPVTPHHGGPGPAGWAMWYCELAGTDVPDIFGAAGIDVRHPHLRPVAASTLVSPMTTMMDAYEIDFSAPRLLAATGAAWNLVTSLMADESSDRRGPLDRAVEHIGQHLAEEIRVPDLAASVGLSASRLQRIFRDALGTGVRGHQIELRMRRARELLGGSDLPIAHVASTVGYADPAYFSRHFHEVNGVSPTAYRREAAGSVGQGRF